jgi:hypothetical protein
VFLEAQFGMRVKIASPGDQIVMAGGDAGMDRHGAGSSFE